MSDDERLPDEAALEAVAEPVTEETAEAPKEEPKEAETEDSPPQEEEVSESKKRRERRKAHMRELESQKAEAEAKLQRIKDAGLGDEPKEEDFADPMEYVAAKAVFSYNQLNSERDTKLAEAEFESVEQRHKAEVQAAFAASVEEAKGRYEDYNEVAFNRELSITDTMGDQIQRADNGADVLYHLGSNPAEALRISSLNPTEQVFELGRISAALTAPKPKTITQAPTPIKPVSPRGSAQRDPAKMSMAEYREWRAKG